MSSLDDVPTATVVGLAIAFSGRLVIHGERIASTTHVSDEDR
jgi:hypothetical protein